MTEYTVCGIELNLALKRDALSSVSGSKVFYKDHLGQKIELQDVSAFSIPQTTGDSLLYINLTLPLLNVTYQGESK